MYLFGFVAVCSKMKSCRTCLQQPPRRPLRLQRPLIRRKHRPAWRAPPELLPPTGGTSKPSWGTSTGNWSPKPTDKGPANSSTTLHLFFCFFNIIIIYLYNGVVRNKSVLDGLTISKWCLQIGFILTLLTCLGLVTVRPIVSVNRTASLGRVPITGSLLSLPPRPLYVGRLSYLIWYSTLIVARWRVRK